MSKEVWRAVSVSTETYVHVVKKHYSPTGLNSVSAGLAGETTLFRDEADRQRDVQVFVAGAFQASAPVSMAFAPNASAGIEYQMDTFSAGNTPFLSSYPVPEGFAIHFSMASANGAQSVDIYLG